MKYFLLAYLAVTLIMSLVTFVTYGWDKRLAQLDSDRRIPEARLHWMAWLGGWPGALIGRRYFRHKTQKVIFSMKTWGIALLHVLLLAGGIWAWFAISSR